MAIQAPQKIPMSQLIHGLRERGVYDPFTQRKLDLLTGGLGGAPEISQRERALTQQIFGARIEEIQRTGEIVFDAIAESDKGARPGKVVCAVTEFLGLGNTGPVYSVTVDKQPFALKLYSAEELTSMMRDHGKFGLPGVLYDIEDPNMSVDLSDLGKKVLSRTSKGVYGRAKRIVKVHKVGRDRHCLYLLMDLLAVDPIGKLDPAQVGGDVVDLVSWAVDCVVGLCHLHVEERRLHLNIRPEAFIRKVAQPVERLPRYTFFHYPKKFYRPEKSSCLTTEFIMVDHLDNSVDADDTSPKGIGNVGSWPFLPPETILYLLQVLRKDFDQFVLRRGSLPEPRTIRIKRSQLDDVWALGMILHQFLSAGKFPFGEPKTLAELVNSILLTKFDFSHLDPRLGDLVSALLDKDPKKRTERILEGVPEKMASRGLLAEAILYKLEEIAVKLEPQ